MRSYRPEELFDADGRLRPELRALAPERRAAHEREPARERRRAPRRPRAARLPRLRRRRSTSRARRRAEATRVLGTFLRDVIAKNPRRLPAVRARRDGVEPARRRLRRDRARLGRRARADRRGARPRRPGDGGALGAPVPGLARGLPPDRPPRPLQLLRGVHPHRRLDVQPAREVVEGDARHPVAPADRLAELPALLARLAPGPQRLLAPGPRLHRPRRQQEGRGDPRLPAARRQHAAVGRRPLPALAQLRQRDRRRQAAGAELPVDRRGDHPLHARRRHLGLGLERRRRRAGRRARPAAATSRRSRRWPPSRSCASTSPSSRCASSTSST